MRAYLTGSVSQRRMAASGRAKGTCGEQRRAEPVHPTKHNEFIYFGFDTSFILSVITLWFS